MAQDLFRNFRDVVIRELIGRGADGRCLCCSDEHVHLADVCCGLEFVNRATVFGPDKQVGRYPGSGRFYKDAIRVAFDLESVASRGCHRDWLADFDHGQVIERSVDLGNRLLLSSTRTRLHRQARQRLKIVFTENSLFFTRHARTVNGISSALSRTESRSHDSQPN